MLAGEARPAPPKGFLLKFYSYSSDSENGMRS